MELVVRFIRRINLQVAIFFAILAILSFITMDGKTVMVISIVLCLYSAVMHVLTNIFFNLVKKIMKNT